jgi:non-specific serine/threonine protein kinase
MLSRRQTEVVNLVAAGHSNREIAERLWLSERTVESHVAALFAKLGVGSRTELATRFLGDGLVDQMPKTNLPLPGERTIGREREIGEIRTSLLDDRLVTLTGAGGVGKTRTAIAAAADLSDRFHDGIWLAELAPLQDGHRVAASIAQAAGLEQLPEGRQLESLVARLKRRALLLVLDNCEHLIAAAAEVVDALLRGCPEVRILATSREPLKVAGECVYLVTPLRVPSPEATRTMRAAEAGAYAALALFIERARQANRHFALSDDNAPLVAEICRRVDGIPLAIELAAARTRTLPLATLAAMLDQRFAILTGGARTALPRQQTMRALFDWSYKLLSRPEQFFFDRLSVFAGGWTLESAAAVCVGEAVEEGAVLELLASLVEKSLAATDLEAAGPRYRLSESAREYARERLAAHGEQEIVARRHALTYLELAEELERAWETMPERAWLARARPDVENWRAALRWTLEGRNDVIIGQRLAGALRLLFGRVAFAEGRRWVRMSLECAGEETPASVVAKLEYAQAMFAIVLGQHREALAAAGRALASYRILGERVPAAHAQSVAGMSQWYLGQIHEDAALARSGEDQLHEALVAARELGNLRLVAYALSRTGFVARARGDMAQARALFAEELEAWKAVGAEGGAANAASNFAEAEFQFGDPQAALKLAGDALSVHRALNNAHNAASNLASMAAYLVALARYDEALAHAREALKLARELQFDFISSFALQHIAAVAALRDAISVDDSERSAAGARAATLLGFIDARLGALEFKRTYLDQQEYDRMVARLGATLGPGELTRLMAAGATLTPDQAIEEAELI